MHLFIFSISFYIYIFSFNCIYLFFSFNRFYMAFIYLFLKGSYDVDKNNIIWCIWCNAMCSCGLRLKKHIIFHILYIIVAPLCSTFLKRVDFYKVRHALICQLSSALWLAEYLKRVMEMLRLLPYYDAMSQRDETKTTKPIINEAFFASSGDIITYYNDLYCLLLSLYCLILYTVVYKQQALLYIAQNSHLNHQWQII